MAEHGQAPPRLRVAQLMNSDLRPYRLRFLELVGRAVDLTVYADEPSPGQGAPPVSPDTSAASFRVERVRNIRWPGGGHRQMWQRGVIRLLRGRYDVIVIPEVVFNASVWLVRLLAHRFGSRIAVFGFGYRPRISEGARFDWIRRRARRFLLSGADVAIVYTDRGREALVADGFEEDRVFVTKNALDVKALRATAARLDRAAVEQFRAEVGGDHVLVFLGRLLDVKRLDLVIDAIRVMQPQPGLAVIGDGPARPALEERARGLPVKFLGAVYDEAEVAAVLAAADLAVIPGKVGLAAVQCLAHGVPVVTASREVAFQTPEYDYLVDRSNARIVDELDPDAFAAEIQMLLDDDDALAAMAAAAAVAADGLSVENMADQFVSALLRASSSSLKSER